MPRLGVEFLLFIDVPRILSLFTRSAVAWEPSKFFLIGIQQPYCREDYAGRFQRTWLVPRPIRPIILDRRLDVLHRAVKMPPQLTSKARIYQPLDASS